MASLINVATVADYRTGALSHLLAFLISVNKRVTPLSVLLAPSTRGVLLPTLRQTRVIASHMGTSSVDRVLLLPMRHVNERR
jgi:hypothetical protein